MAVRRGRVRGLWRATVEVRRGRVRGLWWATVEVRRESERTVVGHCGGQAGVE